MAEKTAAEEFAEIEDQVPTPEPNGVGPAAEGGVRPGAPLLTVGDLIRPTETVKVRGELYALSYLFDYSFGRQASLANDRNATIVYMNREIAGELLSAEELAEQRFFLRRIVRAALPSLPTEQIEGIWDVKKEDWALPPLSDADLEDVASLFFGRTREIRDAATAAAAPPAASPPTSAG